MEEPRGEFIDVTNHPRKRRRNEEGWSKKQAKQRRNSGEGKEPAIGCHHLPQSYCKAARLTEGDIADAFQACYVDSDKVRQDTFIMSHFTLNPVVRHRRTGPAKRDRAFAPTFKVTTQAGEHVEVCSASFKSIFALGRKRLSNLTKFSWENNSNPRPERRGGQREKDGFAEMKDRIRVQIKSFRCCASHYGRTKTPHKRYLPSSLNIRRMWELFNKENTGQAVKYNTYYKLFVTEFNIGFGNPRTDVCSFCVGLKAKIASENDNEKKKTLVTELLVHRSRSRKFYEFLHTKPDDSTLMVSFDLMQNQALPKTPVGEAYYARQLWLYVLGIVEHKPSGEEDVPGTQAPEDIHFYSWGEQEMGRGANQVASALKHFLDRRLSTDPQIKKVLLFSDSCVGQNKNFVVLGMLNLLATQHKVEVEHLFPVRGHSYMPADRAFGRVERKLRRLESILLPSDYLSEFATVGQVYVHGVDWRAYDVKKEVEKIIKRPASFKITEAKRIVVKPVPEPVTICNFYSSSGTQHTLLKRGKRWSTVKLKPLPIESCVKPAKKKDVLNLLNVIGFTLDADSETNVRPCTYTQAVSDFYKPICQPGDEMDISSDESDEDEATVAIYDD